MRHALLAFSIVTVAAAASPARGQGAADRLRNDWADLARYRAANDSLGAPKAGEQRVIFMGNSITDSWARLFPEQFPGKPYVGRGISGQTTPQMLVRFRQDVVALQPAVVVILAGTNDIAGNTGPSTLEMIEDNLRSMTEIAKANHIRVVLSSVLPVFDYPWKPGLEPAPKIVALNRWMRAYADTAGAVYLDYHTPMADARHGLRAELTRDGVHPTVEGYRIMAPLAEAAIERALSRPGDFDEETTIIHPADGVTATIVAPSRLDRSAAIDLILYALPNGNTTAETMGRQWTDSAHWRNDIQHIAAQTRELRARGVRQAVVAYLEAEGKSWPEWRRRRGYDSANKVIVGVVDSITGALGRPPHLSVTLAGHSGGGSLMFGYLEAQSSLPAWLDRIVFLDANYNFDKRHGPVIADWLGADPAHRLEVVAYDDREIMLDGKKVVSDSGGTWRATQRMLDWLSGRGVRLTADSIAGFARWRNAQIEILRHPNPENRILHTEMIGEMNAYLHALLAGRPGYDDRRSVLGPPRAYTHWVF